MFYEDNHQLWLLCVDFLPLPFLGLLTVVVVTLSLAAPPSVLEDWLHGNNKLKV